MYVVDVEATVDIKFPLLALNSALNRRILIGQNHLSKHCLPVVSLLHLVTVPI